MKFDASRSQAPRAARPLALTLLGLFGLTLAGCGAQGARLADVKIILDLSQGSSAVPSPAPETPAGGDDAR